MKGVGMAWKADGRRQEWPAPTIATLKRRRYHRGDFEQAMEVALVRACTTGETRYISATSLGYCVERKPAPFGRMCIKVYRTESGTYAAEDGRS